MPTYVYQCRDCEVRSEVVQRMTDDPLTACESCGGSVRRVLQPVGIVFKGSGFYVTDYKRSDGDSNGKSAASENGKSAPSDNGKSADSSNGKTDSSATTATPEKTEKKEPAKASASA